MLHFSNFTRLQGYISMLYNTLQGFTMLFTRLQYNNITQVVNTSYKATQGITTRL